MGVISARAKMFFPLSLLILILSGGYMFTKYTNSEFSSLQFLLLLKVLLALTIASGLVYSLVIKELSVQVHEISNLVKNQFLKTLLYPELLGNVHIQQQF